MGEKTDASGKASLVMTDKYTKARIHAARTMLVKLFEDLQVPLLAILTRDQWNILKQDDTDMVSIDLREPEVRANAGVVLHQARMMAFRLAFCFAAIVPLVFLNAALFYPPTIYSLRLAFLATCIVTAAGVFFISFPRWFVGLALGHFVHNGLMLEALHPRRGWQNQKHVDFRVRVVNDSLSEPAKKCFARLSVAGMKPRLAISWYCLQITEDICAAIQHAPAESKLYNPHSTGGYRLGYVEHDDLVAVFVNEGPQPLCLPSSDADKRADATGQRA